MPRYHVYLYIGYLPHIKDPEGETIRRELFERLGYSVEVRAGKCIRLTLEAANGEDAGRRAVEMARALRLGNPHVHTIELLRVEECPQ